MRTYLCGVDLLGQRPLETLWSELLDFLRDLGRTRSVRSLALVFGRVGIVHLPISYNPWAPSEVRGKTYRVGQGGLEALGYFLLYRLGHRRLGIGVNGVRLLSGHCRVLLLGLDELGTEVNGLGEV